MIRATDGDKPESFRAPSTVSAIEICPVSGRRATDACRRAPGGASRGEYFARGTEPADSCLVHRGDFIRTLSAESAVSFPATVPLAPAPPAPAANAVVRGPAADSVVPAKEQQQQQTKKRGFWSRLFGVGGNDKKAQKK
jgi:hypothetical protein